MRRRPARSFRARDSELYFRFKLADRLNKFVWEINELPADEYMLWRAFHEVEKAIANGEEPADELGSKRELVTDQSKIQSWFATNS